MASRLMSRWLNRPLRDRAVLEARQESIACLLERYRFENLQPQLKEIGDLERILARIGLRNARPRDLARLRDALAALPDLQNAMTELEAPHLQALATTIGTYPELAELLAKAIIDNPPAVIRDGGVIKTGYDAEPGRAAGAERKRRAIPDGPGSAREGPHRPAQPEGRLQPHPWLLHRACHGCRPNRRRPTTSAGRP